MTDDLRSLLPTDTVHVCVDMQRMFAEDTPWRTPWMPRVLPRVEALVAHRPDRTLFTRFIPADRPGEGTGLWKSYWKRWEEMTLARLAPGMIEIVDALRGFAPPASVVDKTTYSPWEEPTFEATLRSFGATTLVVTGGETDICVLTTVLGAVDRGYRTVVVTDGVCSSSDEAHDAMMTLFDRRYSHHVHAAKAAEVVAAWTR